MKLFVKRKYIFKKLQREKGMLEWDCDRLVRNDRVIWASCMVACQDADAMITGNTRRYSSSLEKIIKVVDPRPGEIMFGMRRALFGFPDTIIAHRAARHTMALASGKGLIT